MFYVSFGLHYRQYPKVHSKFGFANAFLYVDIFRAPAFRSHCPCISLFPGFPGETRDLKMIRLMSQLNSDPMFLLSLKSFESDGRGEGSEMG